MYALPVLTYAAACIDWTNEDLTKMDIDTRKILAFKKIMDKFSCIERLYVPRKSGGKGLISIKDQIQKLRENTFIHISN